MISVNLFIINKDAVSLSVYGNEDILFSVDVNRDEMHNRAAELTKLLKLDFYEVLYINPIDYEGDYKVEVNTL